MTIIDRLISHRTKLSLMQNIPSMSYYARQWQALARGFEIYRMPSNAEYCHARAAHYAELSGGEYVRLIDAPVAELVEVA